MLIALWAVLGFLVGGLASGFASALADHQRFRALVGPDAGTGDPGGKRPSELVGVVNSGGGELIIMARRSLWPSALTGHCHNCGASVGLLAAGPSLVKPRQACERCGSALREPWPLGEVAGVLSFGLLAWSFGLGWPLALYSAFAALLLLISLIDLRDRLILDVLTYPSMLAAFAISFFTIGWKAALAGGLIAGGALLLIYLLSVLIYRRGDAFGLGDVKLGLLIGLVLGSAVALTAVLYGILVGGVMGIVVLAVRRDRRMALPYGPSLAIGALLAILISPNVWR
jgi:leader peptidase (prepilin peptidase) / N-methyltransferase